MGTGEGIEPIFAVRDLDATLARSERTGFAGRVTPGFAFVTIDCELPGTGRAG